MQNINVDYIIDGDGKIRYKTKIDEIRMKEFINSQKKESVINGYFSLALDNSDEKTPAQLAKVHVLIKQLAEDTGYTFDEMKRNVKREAGLVLIKDSASDDDEKLKSFSACSKKEIAAAIEACISIGGDIGSNVY